MHLLGNLYLTSVPKKENVRNCQFSAANLIRSDHASVTRVLEPSIRVDEVLNSK